MKSSVEMMMDGVEWVPIEGEETEAVSDLPVATYSGVLKIGPLGIECFRLSNGMAVISEKGMQDFLEWMGIE